MHSTIPQFFFYNHLAPAYFFLQGPNQLKQNESAFIPDGEPLFNILNSNFSGTCKRHKRFQKDKDQYMHGPNIP